MRIAALFALAAAAVPALLAETFTAFSFDDHTIPFRHNLYLVPQQPVKYAKNPVLPRGGADAPDALRAQFYGTVLKINGKWRMWYAAMASDKAVGLRMLSFHPAYAESDDGINWTKPKLGLTEFNGSKANNLVSLSPKLDYALVEPLATFVMYEPGDPNPARRYKMGVYGRYYDRTDTEHKKAHATIYPYFSADGLKWTLAKPTPKAGAFDETETPFQAKHVFEIGGLFKFGGVYYAAGQEIWPDVWMPGGLPSGRTMVVHYSDDFVNWSQDKAFAFQRYGYTSQQQTKEEAHQPAGVWNRGNVLVATYGIWHGAAKNVDRRMDLGFLISNDGLHFREPIPEYTFLKAGKPGEWDRNGLIHGQGYVNEGDETFVYYGTWDLASPTEAGGAVGLAKLPRDRFFAASTKLEGDAQFTTTMIPARYKPSKIKVNVDGLGPDARMEFTVNGAKAALTQSGLAVPLKIAAQPVKPYRITAKITGAMAADVKFYAMYIDE